MIGPANTDVLTGSRISGFDVLLSLEQDCIVPHMHEADSCKEWSQPCFTPSQDVLLFIKKLSKCKRVTTSSMHAMIFSVRPLTVPVIVLLYELKMFP